MNMVIRDGNSHLRKEQYMAKMPKAKLKDGDGKNAIYKEEVRNKEKV